MAEEAPEAHPATPPVPAPIARDAIKPLAAGLFGAVLTALAIVALSFVMAREINSLGFNALVGTAILSIGLIALIVLARAVGISEPAAALGLPPGSIRALLALGLAIVFVSVASWSLGGLFDPVGRRIVNVEATKAEAQAYRGQYSGPGFLVGEEAARNSDGSQKKTADGAEIVVVTVFVARKMNDGLLDLAKQILTISATVLVTVVGFYFGSNSSSEAVRNLRETLADLRGSGIADGDNADLQRTIQQIKAIDAGVVAKLGALGDDPIAPLAATLAGAEKKEELDAQLLAAQKALDDCRSAAETCTTSAAKADEAVGAIRPNVQATELMQTGVRVRQYLADAEKANKLFEKRLADFTAARTAILEGTAKG